ncbi:hypothetical protein [Mycobacterium simiae]|uniref:hypothetical protein n=1 Tax=Mycobacterium simiae TaxID=1784 RepID=UPI00165F1202|nr:hypothetical protein [Mycobacterium simiae]
MAAAASMACFLAKRSGAHWETVVLAVLAGMASCSATAAMPAPAVVARLPDLVASPVPVACSSATPERDNA